jgi:uncharacterized protein
MDPTASPFAQGLAAGLLRYQRCTACAAALTGQRFACTGCGGVQLVWCDAAGTGTVWAVSTVHRAPTEAWRALAPYTLVLVDLDEGPRVMAHGKPGLVIGDRVVAQAVTLAGQALVRFAAVLTAPHAPAPPAAAG